MSYTTSRRLARQEYPPIGRRGAADRGRPPATLGRRGRRSFSAWKATAVPPWTKKARARTLGRLARQSRRTNR